MKTKLKAIALFSCVILISQVFACKKEEAKKDEENVFSEISQKINCTSKQIADAVVEAFLPEELPGFEYFYSGANEDSDNYLPSERAGMLIYGTPVIVEEFNYLEDYAMYIPTGRNVFQVIVMRIKESEKSNLGALADILQTKLGRIDYGELVNYAPDDIPIYENAKVIKSGVYAILLATTDNEKAESVINGMLGAEYSASLEKAAEEEVASAPAAENSPGAVSMDEVINIGPEILFDFKILAAVEPGQVQNETSGARKTSVPRVDVKKHSHNTSFLIGGKCETGAMIRVTGGTEEIFTGSDHGDYLVEVPFAESGASILKLTAETPGIAPSEEVTFVVQPKSDVDYYESSGIYGVIIGYNYMSYFDDCLPDYIGSNLINDSAISSLSARTAKRISDLKEKGCNAEIIYLLVPNTVNIWPEDMPSRYTRHTGDSLLRQWKKGVTDGGATVIDLTDLMLAHKNDEYKIWHKTDSHWSEYGAYLGYTGLMDYIAQRFPDAAPRSRSDFEFENKEVNFGDIYATLGMTLSDLCETTTFAKFNFDPPHFNKDYDTGHVNIYDQNCTMRMSARPIHARVEFPHTTNSNVSGRLPSVYVFRDSFEGPLHAFYTDRFSTATFKNMWDYNFNINEIVKNDPDYILYIISERNIKNVLYN